MRRATSCDRRSGVSTFCRSSASGSGSSGSSGPDTPISRAAFTRISTPSNASIVAESRFAIVSFSRRSPVKMRAEPLSAASSISARSAPSSASAKTTLAPSSRKWRPMARPTPDEAPVTMAVRPAMEKDMAAPGECSPEHSLRRHAASLATGTQLCTINQTL